MRIGTLFSGAGGTDIGAMDANLKIGWAIEHDAEIAKWYKRNLGDHVIVDDILNIDPASLPRVNIVHASPPCPNFSLANPNGRESKIDISLSEKIIEFIGELSPEFFTLENVFQYRKSESWRRIETALHDYGYWVVAENINAADLGIPQSRKRFIVRARKGGFILPINHRRKSPSWFDAVKNIVHSFPLHKLSPKHIATVAEVNTSDFVLITGQQPHKSEEKADHYQVRQINEPAPSITSSGARFIMAKSREARRFTARGMARIQTIPDWYTIPGEFDLSNQLIGNAMPPLMYQRIIESLITD